MRILKKYNRRYSKRYSKKSKRHTRKNIYSKTYKKIQKGGGFFCRKEKTELETTKTELGTTKAELGTTKTELGTTKTALTTAQNELKTTETVLTTAKNELETTKTALKKAENEYKRVVGNNETLKGDVIKLRSEIFSLTNNLNKLQEELKKQKSPTDEEIEGVILDEDDKKEIDDELNTRATRLDSSGFSDKGLNVKDYITNNIERVTKEYKIKKLMKNRRA